MQQLCARLRTRNVPLLALLTLAALLAGCTAPSGLRVDRSFTNANLKNGKMGVAGVVHPTNPAVSDQQGRWAELFTKVIETRKYNFTVVPPAPLADSIGDALLTQAKEEYGKGALSAATLDGLQRQVRGVRYLAFARVASDKITTDRYESTRTQYATSKKQKDKEKRTQVSAIRRTLVMYVDIYDLETKQPVWHSPITENSENTSEHDRREKRGEWTQTARDAKASATIVDILDSLEGREVSKYPGFPPPPSTAEVMVRIFDVAAFHLPKW